MEKTRVVVLLWFIVIIMVMPMAQVSGENPTAVQIAQSNMTAKSPTSFGFVAMMDDPLTVGPEPNWTIVGRAQGIYGSADQNEGALLMTLNFVFTTDKYNGSTLSVLGRNPVFHQYREMPIFGGSGVFRLAQGIATAKTYWFNLTSGDAVVDTLSVLGRNPAFHQYCEMPIVGNFGVFRLAQGIATAKTYWLNLTSGDSVFEYNVMVLHYSH
ncbi:hypothetical protein H5410_052549 [Solanum commersonii]|uniref:Dirigent protein n=1 Tax=Solanum commersonii TaxID=4109 RepID=A0A9J5X1S6_SOLCO|nr:hypothetical protein H5410_052549 [Solanum commersonii]